MQHKLYAFKWEHNNTSDTLSAENTDIQILQTKHEVSSFIWPKCQHTENYNKQRPPALSVEQYDAVLWIRWTEVTSYTVSDKQLLEMSISKFCYFM